MSKIEVDAIDKQSGSTLTLGGSGTAVALASGATQSGFGRTGTVDWDTTPKTATFTAVSGDGFFANTTGSAFNMNLPAGVAGAIVSVADYAGTWQTNNLTVLPNGSDKIGGVAANVVLNTQGQSVTFLFVDSTQGWVNIQDSTSNERANEFIIATGGTESISGNCKIHTFTGPGTFTVCTAALCAANNIVSYAVVAGGGGGGGGYVGGGGGAGGFREVKTPVTPYTASPLDGYPSAPNRITVTATAFPITVGAGGTGNSSSGATDGTSGSVSTFSTITSAGGGYGKQDQVNPNVSPQSGGPGGSGGGANGGSCIPGPTGGQVGGTGNTPPTTPAQGTNGGTGMTNPPSHAAGGGGGATVAGGNASGGNGGAGGTEATTSITASPVAYSGGGGGASRNGNKGPGSPGGAGGAGGTGPGGTGPTTALAGTVNRGGGGGGTDNGVASGAGGSGIVIIRYKFQ